MADKDQWTRGQGVWIFAIENPFVMHSPCKTIVWRESLPICFCVVVILTLGSLIFYCLIHRMRAPVGYGTGDTALRLQPDLLCCSRCTTFIEIVPHPIYHQVTRALSRSWELAISW